MRLIVEYVRQHMGEDTVARMLDLADERRPISVLEDEKVWSSYDQKIALFAAAASVTGNPAVARSIGETVLRSSVGTSLRIALGVLGSPAMLLRTLARANGKFSTVGSMRAEDVTSSSGTVLYRVQDGYALSRFDCDYTVGLLTQIPALFGLPAASVEHPQSQVEGARECVYLLKWPRRGHRWSRRGDRSVASDALLDRLRQLQATLSDLVASTDVDEVLDAIAGRAGSAVNAERFVLAARIRDGEAPRVRSDGFSAERAGRLADDLLADRPVRLDGEHMLTAEVRTSTRVYGRLAAFARFPFLDYEVELLESYAGLAATALEAVTAVAEAEERRRTAEALLDMAGQLHRARSREDISESLAVATRTVVSADVASVLLFDEDRQRLSVVGHSGWTEELAPRLDQVEIRAEDTAELARLLAQPDSPLTYRDDCEDPVLRRLLREFRTQLVAAVPLHGGGGVHGVLVAGWLTGSPVEDLEDGLLEKMRALSDQATNALDKAELMWHVEKEATSDPLTGLANRRLLRSRLEAVMGDPAAEGRHPALLFIDLDGFKQVNDTLGHGIGDELLRTVAVRLRRNTRTDDLVARLGGDEFTVLLSSVSGPEAALDIGRQLMAVLSEPTVIDGHPVQVRCSIGVVMIDSGNRTPLEVLSDADAAMYGAKKSGGNRCALSGQTRLEAVV